MRIALDHGPLYGHRTGVGAAVGGLVTALDERSDLQVDPYLVSFRATPHPGHKKLPMPGIVASHVWSRIDRPRADRWLRPADVVHGTNYVAPPSRIPTVISVYDCWFLANAAAATPLVRRAGDNLRRRVAGGAWVHTSSEATAVQARSLLDTDRVVAIHLGLPELSPSPTQAPAPVARLDGTEFVLAIGTEERRKDLPMLVRAFGELADGHPTARLVLAGAPGDQSTGVTRAISSMPPDVAARIDRLGIVDAATKSWLLRHASVLAYPSLDEGFGFPILEAQLAATPIVASDVGSVGEVAGAGAALVGDRSPSSFAKALATVMTDGAQRLRLIADGSANLQRFSWKATGHGFADIYRLAVEAT